MQSSPIPNDTRPSPPSDTRDTVFPGGYIGYQQPALLSLVAASQGYLPPDPAAPFHYLELGCGPGATLNGLAAANPQASFVGVDSNPAHIRLARTAAVDAQLDNVDYIEAAFEDLAVESLPLSDYIATNDTYSWLGPAAATALHGILERRLRPGGLLFLDTLSLPGKAPIAPLWYFLRKTTESRGGDGESRVIEGMRLLSCLKDARSRYLTQNPPAAEILDGFLSHLEDDKTRRQWAHQALAAHAAPAYFPDIRDRLAAAGVEFVGSTRLAKNDLDLAVPAAVRPLVDAVDDPALVELIKDFCLDEQQRKDVFVKAPTYEPEAAAAFLGSHFHLVVTGDRDLCRRRLAALNLPPDHPLATEAEQIAAAGPGSGLAMGGLLARAAQASEPVPAIPKAMIWLLDAGLAAIAKEPPQPVESSGGPPGVAGAFNTRALSAAMAGGETAFLASPVTGGCVPLSPADAVVLKLRVGGGESRATVAAGLHGLSLPLDLAGTPRPGTDLHERDVDDLLARFDSMIVPLLAALKVLAPGAGRAP
ncbi:MAG: methyltransferase domain-containing protein [Alphaproteobacteria bacterium]|nr:methyltransferase domain-containing protein [Alphaproteobacteria bacterium]